MTAMRILALTLLMGLLFPLGAMAHDSMQTDSLNNKRTDDKYESIFPGAAKSLAASHFSWGAEVGSSIDVTGHDMSTMDLDVNFGYKSNFIRILGVGAGVHRAFGSGNNFIPVYLLFRTSFSSRPKLLFMNLKLGYSFNTIGDAPTFGDSGASLGCGVNLAMGRNFKSHLSLSLAYRHFNKRHQAKVNLDTYNVILAQINFGVNF